MHDADETAIRIRMELIRNRDLSIDGLKAELSMAIAANLIDHGAYSPTFIGARVRLIEEMENTHKQNHGEPWRT